MTDRPPSDYEADTDGMIVRVQPHFLAEESQPASSRFVWAYEVEIENRTERTWTLVMRHWRIVDAAGRSQTVDGEGVVGQTPRLAPGERFRYTSGAPLSAPSGLMGGSYDFIGEDGEEMRAVIPTFSLDSPFDGARPS